MRFEPLSLCVECCADIGNTAMPTVHQYVTAFYNSDLFGSRVGWLINKYLYINQCTHHKRVLILREFTVILLTYDIRIQQSG